MSPIRNDLLSICIIILIFPSSFQLNSLDHDVNSSYFLDSSSQNYVTPYYRSYIPVRPPYHFPRPFYYRYPTPSTTTLPAPKTTRKNYKFMPPGTTVAFNNIFQMPFQPPMDQVVMNMAVVYKYNTSYLEPGSHSRKRRVVEEHSTFFNSLERSLSVLGLDGKSCIMHAICETAEKLTAANSILMEIMTTILRPKIGIYNIEYLDAHSHGRYNGGCWEKFSINCPYSITQFLENFVQQPL